jgi:uncharacterized membrane protein
MSKLATTIIVYVPVSEAYSKWTDFEAFPRFMTGVRSVERLDDSHYRWRVSIWGKEEEWVSEITKRIPDQRLEWRYTSGARNAGAITFLPLSHEKTLITLQFGYDPLSLVEQVGNALGVVERRVAVDFAQFKHYVER